MSRTHLENKVIGEAEEAFIRSNHFAVFKHPFSIYSQILFLCVTGDFVTKDNDQLCVIEVKNLTNRKKFLNFIQNTPQRTILQIWMELDALKVDRGKLIVYNLDRVAKTVAF